MNAAVDLAATVGVSTACEALGIPRASYYRRLSASLAADQADCRPVDALAKETTRVRPRPERALGLHEEQRVLDVLHSDRFIDRSPAHVVATLLDEGIYLCSERTMYRILHKHGEVKERRNQRRHPVYAKPELLATKPNQVWSWDITKLKGPAKWTYFYLYVILDIFSRYVVGWMVAPAETAELARQLIEETCQKEKIVSGELTIHADRGSPMKAKTTALLMADLGIIKSHSRPYVSDDNPFSESQFKTLKYCPEFPGTFGSITGARAFCRPFFRFYNSEHRHGGIGMMTPATVHFGRASATRLQRQHVLNDAYAAHPERFVHGRPTPPPLPEAVWINQPTTARDAADKAAQSIDGLDNTEQHMIQ